MLLKCYHYLHPMVESKVEFVDKIKDTKFDLDILEQTHRTSEPTTKLVNREMLIFMRYEMDSKEIKCHFQLWAKHEAIFPILDFLVGQILEIVRSQIEIEKKFFLVGILTKLRRYHLQFKNFRKINIYEQKMTK